MAGGPLQLAKMKKVIFEEISEEQALKQNIRTLRIEEQDLTYNRLKILTIEGVSEERGQKQKTRLLRIVNLGITPNK